MTDTSTHRSPMANPDTLPTDQATGTGLRRVPRLPGVRKALGVLGEYAAETVYRLVHPESRRSGATAEEASTPATRAELATLWVDRAGPAFNVALVCRFEAGSFARADGSVD